MRTNFVFKWLYSMGSWIKGMIWKHVYQHMAKSYQHKEWKFMNYGYAALDGAPETIPLATLDVQNRYCIQLYQHVVGDVDLKGLDVLEVGSGRGGGAEYIKRYLMPKTVVGVDFAEDQVNFCNANYATEGLFFRVGNAVSLPFEDGSFDAVVNVESSHCYPSMDAFLGQVKRVLRQGGYFLFADMRLKQNVDRLQRHIERSGLKLIRRTDITPNVIRALEVDNAQRTAIIKQMGKKSMTKALLKFAGTENSPVNRNFRNGGRVYLSYVLQKV